MRLRHLIDFLLVSSYCSGSGLSVTSSNAQSPEPPFNRTCCSDTLSAGVSHTRLLRASTGVVPNEIEGAANAFLARIAATHFDPQQKRGKVSEGATSEHGFLQERLVETTKELFRQPEFKQWIEHVNELKGKNPEQEISAIPTLTAHFGDEELYKILDVAITIPEYRILAKNLKAEQMQHWMKMNKDPETVFDMFGLGKEENIFKNPKFLDYVTYADRFFSARISEKRKSMITTIIKHHNVAILIRQIDQVKTFEDGKIKYATIRLEDYLMTHLVETQPLSGALGLLQLGPHSQMPRIGPICMQLLECYLRRRPDMELAPFKELVDIFGEDVVTLWIFTGKVDDIDVSGKLESALRAYWRSKNRSFQDIVTLLEKVAKINRNLFRTQVRKTWLSYVGDLIKKEPDMAKTFFTYLGTNIQMKFLLEVFKEAVQYRSLRRAIETPPHKMFKELGLADDEEKLITNPLFPVWLAYDVSFSRRHPDYPRQSLRFVLYSHFGGESAQRLINKLSEQLRDEEVPSAFKQLLKESSGDTLG